jgi:hypothetical protein
MRVAQPLTLTTPPRVPKMTAATLNFEEFMPMTNQPATEHAGLGPISPFIPMLKTAALVVTILGAIPTAITAYNAYSFGVPFQQVPHRLAQYDLWVKNLDCKIDYKALNTAQGTKVDVGACSRSGDIAIKISSNDGKSTYEWIAYNQLQKPGATAAVSGGGLLDLLIGTARADDVRNPSSKPVRMAEGMQVVCQSLSGKQIVRIVSEGGKCFKEVVSPLAGTVEKREDVPCNTQCPGAG